MIVKGTIKNITEYGAFVDLGGIDGLLHITDMSWGRVNHPSEVFKVGDEVTVKVLKYNPETERVSLGLKQTQEDPWNHAEEAYPAGQEGPRQGHVDHRLRRVRRARAGRRGPHPRQRDELDQEGQAPVEAPRGRPGGRVPGARGRRARQAHQPRPQAARARSLDALHRQVPPGRHDRAARSARSPTTASSSASKRASTAWSTRATSRGRMRVNNPADLYHKGDEVEAIILSINHDEKKVSLGIKQLYDDPWPSMLTEFPLGRGLRGRRRASASSTTACSCACARASKASSRSRTSLEPEGGKIKIGDKVKCEVSSVDTVDRRLFLTMKNIGAGEAGRRRAPQRQRRRRRGRRRRRQARRGHDRRPHQGEARRQAGRALQEGKGPPRQPRPARGQGPRSQARRSQARGRGRIARRRSPEQDSDGYRAAPMHPARDRASRTKSRSRLRLAGSRSPASGARRRRPRHEPRGDLPVPSILWVSSEVRPDACEQEAKRAPQRLPHARWRQGPRRRRSFKPQMAPRSETTARRLDDCWTSAAILCQGHARGVGVRPAALGVGTTLGARRSGWTKSGSCGVIRRGVPGSSCSLRRRCWPRACSPRSLAPSRRSRPIPIRGSGPTRRCTSARRAAIAGGGYAFGALLFDDYAPAWGSAIGLALTAGVTRKRSTPPVSGARRGRTSRGMCSAPRSASGIALAIDAAIREPR